MLVCVKPQCNALGVGRFCGLQPDSNGCRVQCEVTRFDVYWLVLRTLAPIWVSNIIHIKACFQLFSLGLECVAATQAFRLGYDYLPVHPSQVHGECGALDGYFTHGRPGSWVADGTGCHVGQKVCQLVCVRLRTCFKRANIVLICDAIRCMHLC